MMPCAVTVIVCTSVFHVDCEGIFTVLNAVRMLVSLLPIIFFIVRV